WLLEQLIADEYCPRAAAFQPAVQSAPANGAALRQCPARPTRYRIGLRLLNMTHFKIVMTGSSILVDHYGSTEPIVGFVACRLLKAESEELAIATAKRDILVQW